MNGLVLKETRRANFAKAAKNDVSNTKVDALAAPPIGMWEGGGTNAGKSSSGNIGANLWGRIEYL